MFQLSQTHNQAFQAKADADFVREIMQYLRENHGETIPIMSTNKNKIKNFSDESLKLFCQISIKRAKQNGLTSGRGIRTFVLFMATLGEVFYEHPLAKKNFPPFAVNPNESVFNLLHLTETEWQEVKNYCKEK